MAAQLNNTRKSKIDLNERIAIITAYPLFCLLNADDIHELALLLQDISVETGTVIIHENAIVDSFYFIVSGTAEVTRTIAIVEMTEIVHVADLNSGDTIGLAEDDLYARRGLRTANVTATSPMALLKLNLANLNDFLKKHGVAYPGLTKLCERISLMNFIQKSKIFGRMSNETIQRLSHKIKLVKFKTGDHYI